MTRFPRLLFWEKVGIAMFASLAVVGMAWTYLYTTLWIGGAVIVGIFWLIALCICVAVVLSLDEEDGWRDKLRILAAGPFAFLAAFFLQPAFQQFGMNIHARVHLDQNEQWVATAPRNAAPLELRFIEGVPDGGVSIVHVPRAMQADRAASEVINGNVRWCRRLRDSFNLCGFG